MPTEYFSTKLSLDYTKLLETSNDYNVIIEIGELDKIPSSLNNIPFVVSDDEEKFKTFKAHSLILKSRCKYFEAALSYDWVKRDDNDKIILKKPNIHPKIFSIILKYIYDGSLNLDHLPPSEILLLLLSSDELAIDELINHIQKYLIINHSKYIQENIHHILNLTYNHSSYKDIQYFCIEKVIINNPLILFNSINFFHLHEEILLELLDRDDFNKFNEIDIWGFILKWGIYQSNDQLSILSYYNNNATTTTTTQLRNDEEWLLNLELKDLIDHLSNECSWGTKEYNTLGKSLENLSTKIRFIEFLKSDFIKFIIPFKEIFNIEFYNELQDHFYILLPSPPPKQLLFNNLNPMDNQHISDKNDSRSGSGSMMNGNGHINNINTNIPFLFPKKIFTLKPPRRRLDSEIITNDHIKIITNWLDHKDGISSSSSHSSSSSSSSISSQFTLTPTTTTFLATSMNAFLSSANVNHHPSLILKPPYTFTLLYRASRDSFNLDNLHKIIDYKVNILIVARISNTNELIGGYNPIGWDDSNKPHPDSINSFIFSFRDNNPPSSPTSFSPPLLPRISRLKRELIDKIVFNSKTGYISFGSGSDLRIGGVLNPKTGHTKLQYYENKIRDFQGIFYIDDYEVFQIS